MDQRIKIYGFALLMSLIGCVGVEAAGPDTETVKAALKKAVGFFDEKVSVQGGYVWEYSGDLTLREGEGTVDETRVWVQPPGTPAVAEAILEAYFATGDEYFLKVAKKTGDLLVENRHSSGGWYYYIELDDAKKKKISKRARNRTTLDDETTQAALRFLIKLDYALGFKDKKIHEGVMASLNRLRIAQYPVGGWYQNWQHVPKKKASEKEFPVIPASYPEKWSRKWLNDWTGEYYLNDEVQMDMIDLYLLAGQVYDDEQWMDVAKKAGDFLILAQMPRPQPGWAQQYDEHMHPVWDRKFEPPAISGAESQSAMQCLMRLYEHTGDRKYLKPIAPALAYFNRSLLPDGQLARFYELKTNKPLYFYIEGRVYHLTYDDSRLPTHYGFKISSKLKPISEKYRQLSARAWKKKSGDLKQQLFGGKPGSDEVTKIVESLDGRGAWVEQKRLRFHKREPDSGVIDSKTFIDNVKVLNAYLYHNQ